MTGIDMVMWTARAMRGVRWLLYKHTNDVCSSVCSRRMHADEQSCGDHYRKCVQMVQQIVLESVYGQIGNKMGPVEF